MQSGGEYAGQHIAADEPADTGKETDRRVAGDLPSQYRTREFACCERHRFERVVGERVDIDVAEEVVHHGVADEHDVLIALAGSAGGFEEFVDHPAICSRMTPTSLLSSRRVQRP